MAYILLAKKKNSKKGKNWKKVVGLFFVSQPFVSGQNKNVGKQICFLAETIFSFEKFVLTERRQNIFGREKKNLSKKKFTAKTFLVSKQTKFM